MVENNGEKVNCLVISCGYCIFKFFDELDTDFCGVITFELILNKVGFNSQLHLYNIIASGIQ